jgi:hypothetical protein
MPVPISTYCSARPACRYAQEAPGVENLDDIDQSSSFWRFAWIEGREIPGVAELALPSTDMGQLVRKAYVEQTSLGWNSLFRGFWSIA